MVSVLVLSTVVVLLQTGTVTAGVIAVTASELTQ